MADLTQDPLAARGGFDAMLNNPLQKVAAPIPQNPAEVQARRGQWSQLLDDPNMKSALFRMGLQMMQGVPQGQTALGATAAAGMDAMDYYGAKNELDRKRALEGQKAKREQVESEANVANTQARTAEAIQTTSQKADEFTEWKTQSDNRKKKATLEIGNLERVGRKEDALLKKHQFEIDEAQRKADFIKAHPDLANRVMTAEVSQPIVENQLKDAQIGNYESNMRASDANIGINRSELSIKQAAEAREAELWDSMTPEERKLAWRKSKDGTAGQEYTAQAESILSEYERLSPEEKKRYPTVDSFVTMNYNVTLGKSASGVLGEIKRLQASGNTSGSRGAKTFTMQDLRDTLANPKNKGRSVGEIQEELLSKGYTYIGE